MSMSQTLSTIKTKTKLKFWFCRIIILKGNLYYVMVVLINPKETLNFMERRYIQYLTFLVYNFTYIFKKNLLLSIKGNELGLCFIHFLP